MTFRVVWSPPALRHLRHLSRTQQVSVIDGVKVQLTHEPAIETRNRKPMRPNPVAPWELRLGDLRVYYEVGDEGEPTVTILAIGIKVRSLVFIEGEAIAL